MLPVQRQLWQGGNGEPSVSRLESSACQYRCRGMCQINATDRNASVDFSRNKLHPLCRDGGRGSTTAHHVGAACCAFAAPAGGW